MALQAQPFGGLVASPVSWLPLTSFSVSSGFLLSTNAASKRCPSLREGSFIQYSGQHCSGHGGIARVSLSSQMTSGRQNACAHPGPSEVSTTTRESVRNAGSWAARRPTEVLSQSMGPRKQPFKRAFWVILLQIKM